MDFLKFLRSFNTLNTYLIFSFILLMGLIVYFYYIEPR
ncbi:hypothetical protein M0O54_07635 [Acinetobacter lactucae]|uniref:Uncharacterized protein n=1 Tax=Acinetobacter lactucae TaxID=1785128 RepID=A0AB35K3B5_9GAMM|nr:hypothetical protein [Acinetobacter lactucae]MDD9319996.1 hypothetical protein [Acinetobacter lactucae]